jgi:dCMP deaminase
VGLCGGICAGKRTVAQYLAEHHGFKHLHLQTTSGESTSPRGDPEHTFHDVGSLVDYVTKRWMQRWVTTDIHTEEVLDVLVRRPFFILISVDAPVSVRWKRFQKRIQDSKPPVEVSLSLEDFLLRSDDHLYSTSSGLLPLISRATIRLLNTSSDLAHLYATLGRLDLTNEDRLRPSWDQYFMQLASLAAQRSNCMKRRVGCVLVREKRVISTGYNGTPRGLKNCGEGGCARCNDGQGSGVGLGTCLCLHAEENALLEAGRERIRENSTLYCDTCPCLTCSIKITQVGVSEVVYSQGYSMDGETAAVFKEAGVKLRQFSPVSTILGISDCHSNTL